MRCGNASISTFVLADLCLGGPYTYLLNYDMLSISLGLLDVATRPEPDNSTHSMSGSPIPTLSVKLN